MAKVVTILGLASAYANRNAFEGEIWTLNDWYVERCYAMSPPFPCFTPQYVFQVHDEELVENLQFINAQQNVGRWTKDWKFMYNNFAKHTVACYPIKGINNLEVFDRHQARREFGTWVLTSSINYMLVWAWWQQVEYVRLNACPQVNEDYGYQMPGTYWLINILRGSGMFINNPYEAIWAERLRGFDWHEFVKVDYAYGKNLPISAHDLYRKQGLMK